jgi:hypothetical protein
MRIFMTNKWFYTFVLGMVFLFTFVSVFAAYSFLPNPGHGADTVWVSIDGLEMTLQNAIDANYIVPACNTNQILTFDKTGTGKWECSDQAPIPIIEQKVISQLGVSIGTTISCEEGWIRSGCSGFRPGGKRNAGVRPSGDNSCEAFGGDRPVDLYIHCIRLTN